MKILLFCIIMLFTTGCSDNAMQTVEPSLEQLKLEIAVPLNKVNIANIFSQKLSELSNQGMAVDVKVSANPLICDTDFKIVSSSDISNEIPYFGMLNSAFFFKGYKNMTFMLNSDKTLERLSHDMKDIGIPLTALYNGESVLVSRNIQILSANDFEGLTIAIEEDKSMMAAFKTVKASTLNMSLEDRIKSLQSDQVDMIECDYSDITKFENIDAVFYVYTASNKQNPYWLIQSNSIVLTDEQMSILLEAQAYMLYENDKAFQENQLNIINKDSRNNIVIPTIKFSPTIRKMRLSLLNSDVSSKWDISVYNYLQEISR